MKTVLLTSLIAAAGLVTLAPQASAHDRCDSERGYRDRYEGRGYYRDSDYGYRREDDRGYERRYYVPARSYYYESDRREPCRPREHRSRFAVTFGF